MFVSSGQFYVFTACVGFGVFLGILFFTVKDLTVKIKNASFKGVIQFLPFFFSAFLFIIYSNKLNFPTFRVYMLFGVFSGVYLYGKSFRLILAKVVKRVYNIKKEKGKKSDRKQI